MPDLITDVIRADANGNTAATGSVATRLLQSGFSVNALRTNAILRKDEWVQYDNAVVEVARERLGAVEDLISRGLTFPLGNALGTTIVEWEQMSDMTAAEINMAGVTEGERDRIDFTLKSLPIPITHKDFRLNIRALEASRRLGETLDTTQARLASRLVSESIENQLFNGASITVLGNSIPGLTTATNRNTGSVANDWNLLATTGESIVDDVIAMIGAAEGDNMFGPYALYCSIAAKNNLNNDYKANGDRTTLERINAIDGISVVRGTSKLTGTVVILLQLTSDVVDIVVGMQPTTLQWEDMGGMITNFKVMAIMVPRIKDTQTSQSGIVHYT